MNDVKNLCCLIANNSYRGIVHLVGELEDGDLTRAVCGANPKGGWHPTDRRRFDCLRCTEKMQSLFVRRRRQRAIGQEV